MFGQKKKARRAAEEFAKAVVSSLPENCSHHEGGGFCGVCSFYEQEQALVRDLQTAFDNTDDPAKKKELDLQLDTFRSGCEHGVEEGKCDVCKDAEISPKPQAPSFLTKSQRRDGERQLASLPRLDTKHVHEENPRPLADLRRCIDGYTHHFQAPAGPYHGSMARGDRWWPGQKPPREKCQVCGGWRNQAQVMIKEGLFAGMVRGRPSTSEKVHAKGGFVGKATGSLARNLGYRN